MPLHQRDDAMQEYTHQPFVFIPPLVSLWKWGEPDCDSQKGLEKQVVPDLIFLKLRGDEGVKLSSVSTKEPSNKPACL